MIHDFSDMYKMGGIRALFGGLLPYSMLTYLLVSERTIEWEEVDKDEESIIQRESTGIAALANYQFFKPSRWHKTENEPGLKEIVSEEDKSDINEDADDEDQDENLFE